jgi:hypothetical protein
MFLSNYCKVNFLHPNHRFLGHVISSQVLNKHINTSYFLWSLTFLSYIMTGKKIVIETLQHNFIKEQAT